MMKKVLIVDDEERVVALVSATLRLDDRYCILTASNGEEALASARRERPALIFLDIIMPAISGYDVCRALKSDPVTADANIVMLTGLLRECDRREALEAGADDYFTKPFSPAALLRKVEAVLAEPD